jgi:hypothetical protein
LIPAAVCALGAHALLYGTVRPGDGLHGYFGWYEPGLAVLALAALVFARPSRLRVTLPLGETVRRWSTTAIVVLLAQESLERTLQAGQPSFASLTPSQWLVLLVGIAATALVLAFALRAGQVVLGLLRGGVRTTRRVAVPRWNVVVALSGRPRPLAERFALRAPPLAARL